MEGQGQWEPLSRQWGEDGRLENEVLELVTTDVMWGLGGGRTAKEMIRQDLRARVLGESSTETLEILKMMATAGVPRNDGARCERLV